MRMLRIQSALHSFLHIVIQSAPDPEVTALSSKARSHSAIWRNLAGITAESRWHHSGISLVSQRDLALPGVGVGVDVLRCAAGPG